MNFSHPSNVLQAIGTDSAYFRVFGLESDQCPQFTPLTEEVGLVGIIASVVELPHGERVAVGTNLVGAGRDPGSILWNANPEPEESKQ